MLASIFIHTKTGLAMQYLKLKLLINFIFILSLVAPNLYAQEDYLYENISVADGLSSSRFNVFHNICQDRFGFLWFGTTDGLNRYDGYEFKVYKNMPGDSTSLPSSNIQNINEDGDGNLWIGTPGYMSIFNRNSETFTNFPISQGSTPLQQNIEIFNSLADSKNNFWISTRGKSIQKWNKNKQQWELIPFITTIQGVDSLVTSETNTAIAISELRNGNILASEFSLGIFYYNESSNSFEQFKFAGNKQPQAIAYIFEDKGGKIWFTGRDAFIEYNPISFSFEYKNDWEKFSRGGNTFLFNINEREDGTFLLCSFPLGLLKFDPRTEKFDLLKLDKELEERGIGKFSVSKIIDKFGVYWIGLGDNGILKFDPNRRPFKYFSFDDKNLNQNNRAITTDVKVNNSDPNELIVSTDQRGLFKLNLNDKTFTHLNVNIPSIYSDTSNLRCFVIDENQKLWMPSNNHDISSYNLKNGSVETFNIVKRNMQTGTGEQINNIEYFPKNKLVISSTLGIYIFNTESKTVEMLKSKMNRKYDEKLLTELKNILINKKQIASFVKVGEAANLEKKFTLKEKTDALVICLGEGQSPDGMFDFGGIRNSKNEDIWVMNDINKTFNDGGGFKNRLQVNVITLEPGSYSLHYSTDIGHSYNNFNVVPPDDSTWYGIQVIKLDKTSAEKLKNEIADENRKKDYPIMFGAGYVLNSRKYPSDLWIGANENGIIRYNMTNNNFEQYPLKENKAAVFNTGQMFEDSKGRLWFTINPTGFYRFDPQTKKFISNAEIHDLPITGINGIIEDFNRSIWVNSSGGITKLTENKDGSWATSNYDSKDGVTGGFGHGALVTRDGEIYFGAFNGLTGFYPSNENTSPPIPIISNINISDVSIVNKQSGVKLEKSIFETDHLDLSYAQNDLSFDFAALHFSRPSKNRVSYKLEGFNDHWIFTDKNFASFTNLEPGDYVLHVKAYSGFGIPSTGERTLAFTIAPPWYRTTIAYFSYGLIFLGLIFGIDRFQRRRLLTKEREKQKIKEVELRAIAAEAQAKAVEAENERKTKELEEARQLQLSMLPKKLPDLPHLDIAVFMQTATEVGGDYYDFHVSLDGTLTIVIGDATGHGMRAGTMVTAAKSLFSTHAANPDILFTFSEISRCLKYMDMHLLTMCMSIVKIKDNKMIMSAAGMPPTLLFRGNTKQLDEITLKGMPLGAVNYYPYVLKETELNAGDTILLMSDGLPELFDSNKEMYGYDRVQTEFHKYAEKTPEKIIERLKTSASEWTGNSEPDDDITFVVIKIK